MPKMDSYCGGCLVSLGEAWKRKAKLSTDESLCIWCDHCGHIFSGRCKKHVKEVYVHVGPTGKY